MQNKSQGLALPLGTVAFSLVLPLILVQCEAIGLIGGSDYLTFKLTVVMVASIALLGLNILTGFNGQFSLGHAAFYAIGAYTAAIMMMHWDVPFFLTLPVAGFICLVVGFLFGRPALRLEGHFLALATFALSLATPQLLKYKHLEHWTGGVQGIVVDKPTSPLGFLTDDQFLYYFTLVVTVIMFVVAWNLTRSRTGRAMVAIRNHPMAADTMGIDTAFVKSTTFGVSAMFTGVAGALSAMVVGIVAPDAFNVVMSISFLVGIVVGGLGTIAGAIPGALFIVFMPDYAASLSKAATGVVYGTFLILFMFLMPFGIWGAVRRITRFVRVKGGFGPAASAFSADMSQRLGRLGRR